MSSPCSQGEPISIFQGDPLYKYHRNESSVSHSGHSEAGEICAESSHNITQLSFPRHLEFWRTV